MRRWGGRHRRLPGFNRFGARLMSGRKPTSRSQSGWQRSGPSFHRTSAPLPARELHGPASPAIHRLPAADRNLPGNRRAKIQHQEALHVAGLIQAPLALLQAQVPMHHPAHIQLTRRSQEDRNAAVRSDGFLQRLGIQLEQELSFGRRSTGFRGKAHLPSNSAPNG
jgi:hypothetical protein